LTTQHEDIKGILEKSSKPQSLDEVQKFIDRIRPMPRSTLRARLTEMKKKGEIDHTEEGWIISDINGVPTITQTVQRTATATKKKPLKLIYEKQDEKVKLVGVELEGGHEVKPEGLYGDGSVHCGGNYSGEICNKGSLEEILEWTSGNYPTTTDRSCGMHIHVSFTNKLAYMQLMSRTFYYKWFLPKAKEWAEEMNINKDSAFYARLEGKKSSAKYCLKGFHAEKQSKSLTKDANLRYHHLNYCYKQHTTIECRLFPQFQKKELALSAIKFFVNVCNEFLADCKPEKAHHSVVNEQQDHYESFDV